MPFPCHRFPGRPRRTHGFTLVELLVVIAIIGVLVALLLPAVQAAREAARRTQCMNNLRNLALAVANFESANGVFPQGMQYDDTTNIPIQSVYRFGPNWVITILPFMEEQGLHDSFDFSLPISNVANRIPRGQVISVMLCPSDPFNKTFYNGSAHPQHGDNWARGNYGANAGNGPLYKRTGDGMYGAKSPGWKDTTRRGVMGPNVAVKISQIKDGTTKTMLISELRAGPIEGDPRGVWALGHAGASVIAWHASRGDANGPNACNDFADDIPTRLICRTTNRVYLQTICMPCDGSNAFDQATTRGSHVGGVMMTMVDASVHFISNDIETSGKYGPCCTVWDHLVASADQGANLGAR